MLPWETPTDIKKDHGTALLKMLNQVLNSVDTIRAQWGFIFYPTPMNKRYL